MDYAILNYINEQIEDCEIILKQASGSARECVLGSLNALEDVKDFIVALQN